jgi:hypothetical protein
VSATEDEIKAEVDNRVASLLAGRVPAAAGVFSVADDAKRQRLADTLVLVLDAAFWGSQPSLARLQKILRVEAAFALGVPPERPFTLIQGGHDA